MLKPRFIHTSIHPSQLIGGSSQPLQCITPYKNRNHLDFSLSVPAMSYFPSTPVSQQSQVYSPTTLFPPVPRHAPAADSVSVAMPSSMRRIFHLQTPQPHTEGTGTWTFTHVSVSYCCFFHVVYCLQFLI